MRMRMGHGQGGEGGAEGLPLTTSACCNPAAVGGDPLRRRRHGACLGANSLREKDYYCAFADHEHLCGIFSYARRRQCSRTNRPKAWNRTWPWGANFWLSFRFFRRSNPVRTVTQGLVKESNPQAGLSLIATEPSGGC